VRGRWVLAAALVVASCAPVASPLTDAALEAEVAAITLPAMKRFDGALPRPVPMPSNAQLTQDFLDLSFELESGRVLPVFTRFEGPVTVAVLGDAPDTLATDLDDLLVRLRREAGIDISRAQEGRAASITIEALPRRELQRLVPQAACFVVPNVENWEDYLSKRRARSTDWGTLMARTRAAVFLPSDVSPQEIRDCLHEEIAQALGPLNDLYRLPFSVFNDDNLHTILTSYDMAILRMTYDRRLATGMDVEQVATALPAIVARVNKRGAPGQDQLASDSSEAWKRALNRSLQPGLPARLRASAAARAIDLARAAEWNDTRLGYSLLSFGRAALGVQPESAIAAIVEAAFVFRDAYGEEVHTAHAIVQPAAFALTSGQPDVTLRLVEGALPTAQKGQNAALLSTLLLLRAEALEETGRVSEARAVREEGKAWALYGFGSAAEVRRHVAEVAALRPGV